MVCFVAAWAFVCCACRKLETTHVAHVRGKWATMMSMCKPDEVSGALLNHVSAFWLKTAPAEVEETAKTVCFGLLWCIFALFCLGLLLGPVLGRRAG